MKLTLQPSGAVIEAHPGETILEAAQRAGYQCPQSCRNGNCQVCAAVLVEGRVLQGDVEHDHGEIFTCQARPLGDCLLHWDGVLARGELPVGEYACQVVECTPVGGDVYRVALRTPAGRLPRYHAGQYLLLEREDGEFSAFSLASAPHQGRDLQLHILARDGSAIALVRSLQTRATVRVKMPYGDTHLAELPDGPLLLVAAGTGMAQMQSLLEHCRARGFKHPLHLYWGVRAPEEFYRIDPWAEWENLPGLSLHRVVSERCDWRGRCGLLHEAIREDFSDLKGLHVYASGSPAMVYGTLDALVEAGMDAHQMRADVFAYAPRAR